MSLGTRLTWPALPGLALILLASTASTLGDPIVEWVRHEAKPFATTEPRADHSDLAALRTIVGDAHIVGLGEGTHGTHEFFQMKHRITEFLASEMGFHVFAIEANMPEAYRVNDYVLTGRGDPKALIRGMYFWTWQTEEVLAMVEWMRKFNASGRGRIEFLGFDMQTPDTAEAIVRRFVARAEPTYLGTMDSVLGVVRRTAAAVAPFATATGTFPFAETAGHHIEFSGLIRTRAVTGFAGLWWRADTNEKYAAAFSNMQDQAISGTRDWKRYSLALDIPANTTNVHFGMLMAGKGTAWFDSLAVTIDGKPWVNRGDYDLALEDPQGPIGFGRGQGPSSGYRIGMVDSIAAVGRRSLEIASIVPPDTLGLRVGYADADRAVRRVIDHLAGERERLARATSAADVDWAVQNARVVEQSMVMRTRDGEEASLVRDSCMAANIDWILAQAPKGEKIVLWAHNGHVSRREAWMGDWLARRHGRDYVVVGFATARGHYQAMSARGLSRDNELVSGAAGTLEATLAAPGLPRFLLDLRSGAATPAVRDWLDAERHMRFIGARATLGQFGTAHVGRDFDAFVWVDSTSAAIPLPE
jgi:erythromycin esterase-like protein